MRMSTKQLVEKLKRDGTILVDFIEAHKMLNYLRKHGPSTLPNYDIYWDVKSNGKIELSL